MPTGNDSQHELVAMANCTYCAVGGLVGKSANEIMAMVYVEIGGGPPNGFPDDGSAGFENYYIKKCRSQDASPPAEDDSLERQVRGVKGFLESKGCTVTHYDRKKANAAESFVNQHPEHTIFLVLAGEDDGWGTISSMAHWTTCQVQGGTGQYYDYQTKIADGAIRRAVKKRAPRTVSIEFNDTVQSDKIIAPLGQTYTRADVLVTLLKVSKG